MRAYGEGDGKREMGRGETEGQERMMEGGRHDNYSTLCSHLFIDVWDVCFCVLHLDKPLLPIPVGHSIAVSEGTGGTHV